jgi:serine/threonine-protein kinase
MSIVGTVVGGRYEVLGRLGRGGQGDLFTARCVVTDDEVALKFLPERDFQSTTYYQEEYRDKICDEFRNTHSLAGIAGIPRAIDLVECDDRDFIVMELIHGQTLRKTMDSRRPSSQWEAATTIAQLCAILGEVHSRALVHCDVKPANIMIEPGGRVRLLDLGMATEDGKSLEFPGGTTGYSPPEQFVNGGILTCRSDIFALGCVMLEMVTMQLPYGGKRVTAKNGNAVLPAARLEKVPSGLRDLAMRMVALEPADRPADMREVREALDLVMSAPDAPEHSKMTQYDTVAFYRLRSAPSEGCPADGLG